MTSAHLFIGFELIDTDQNRDGEYTSPESDPLSAEVDRLLHRLDKEGADPSSLLTVDMFVSSATGAHAELVQELGRLLPGAARPVVSVIPAKRLPGGQSVRLQAIALPGTTCEAPEDGRFPSAAVGGSFFAVATPPAGTPAGVVAQSTAGLAWLSERMQHMDTTVADVLRFNIFYVGNGTRDDWAESARVRAAHFPEPGPCATGIPVESLSAPAAEIVFQVNGIAGARADGRIIGAWPDGHWDWPLHLPYRHGNRVDNLCFVGGQVSLAPDSSVIAPGDLHAQTATAMGNIDAVLKELGGSLADTVRLTAFYEARTEGDEEIIRRQVQAALPGTGFDLSLVGMDKLAYPEMLVEIECQAMAVE